MLGRHGTMRVLTTWMYFDESEIAGRENQRRRFRMRPVEEKQDGGIGIAWFGGNTTTVGSISNLKAFHGLPGRSDEEALNEETLRNLVDLFLLDADEYEFDRPERSLKNPPLGRLCTLATFHH
jgi:hypothetical protein